MFKLTTIAVATGLAFALNLATAQNVESEKARAQGEEKVMKEKEQGAAGTSHDRSTSQEQPGGAGKETSQSDDSRSAPKPSEPDYTGAKPTR